MLVVLNEQLRKVDHFIEDVQWHTCCQLGSAEVPPRPCHFPKVGGAMDIDSRVKREQKPKRERGFTIIQVLITVSLIAIVSTFGVMAIGSARAGLRLNGSTRELAGYLEKARSDAIRRNDTATVTIVDANSYTVTMDSDGDGTRETRTIRLQDGVTFDNGSIGVSADFDWRGRVPNQLGIVLNNDRGGRNNINLSGAGDVTLDNDFQDAAIGDVTLNTDLPAAVASPSPGGYPTATPVASPSATPYPTPTPTPDPLATPTPLPTATPIPIPTPLATPVPTPIATPYPTPTPTPAPTPIPCTLTAPSTLSFAKNGSPKTFSVTVANGSSSVITATRSGDISTVSPASTTVTGSGTILYTVTYPNGNSSSGTITISSPCGNRTIPVTIN